MRMRTMGRRAVDPLASIMLLALVVAARAAHAAPQSPAPIAIGGAVAVAVSVPLQFAADGHLSRDVSWHNAQFAP